MADTDRPTPSDSIQSPLTSDSVPAIIVVDYQPQWSTWARQLVTVLLVVGTLYAFTLLGPIIQILVISLLVSVLIYFPTKFISRRLKISYRVVVIFFYLMIIVALVTLVLFLYPLATDTGRAVSQGTQQAFENLRAFLVAYKSADGMVEIVGTKVDLNPIIEPIRAIVLGTASPGAGVASAATSGFDFSPIITFITQTLGSIVGGLTSFLTTSFLSLFLSFLLVFEVPQYRRQMFENLPPAYHRELGLLTQKIMRVWQGFFRGQLLVGLLIGLLTYIQLTLMGVQAPVFLAIFTAFVSLIPTLGGIIALIPIGLVALLQGSSVFVNMSPFTFTILVVGVNLIISQVIWNVVAPSIIGDALDLPVPVIILGVFLGLAIGGILGAFLIAPILGSLRVIVWYTVRKINLLDPFPGEFFELQLSELTPPRRRPKRRVRKTT